MTSLFEKPSTTEIALNPFLEPILAFLVCATGSRETNIPTEIIASVTSSPNMNTALWQLWDAFITTVVCTDPLPLEYAPHLAFLAAMQAHSPTEPKYKPSYIRQLTQADNKIHWSLELTRFHDIRRDAHDSMEAFRHETGRASSTEAITATAALSNCSDSSGHSLPPDRSQCYLRICAFSKALLKASEEGGMKGDPIQVFFACRRVLEYGRREIKEQADMRSNLPKQVWALDVHVAVIWARDGGRTLWNADQEMLRDIWALALDEPTDLWQNGTGLTRARWQFWQAKLHCLSSDNQLDIETRNVVAEATHCVEGLLSEPSVVN